MSISNRVYKFHTLVGDLFNVEAVVALWYEGTERCPLLLLIFVPKIFPEGCPLVLLPDRVAPELGVLYLNSFIISGVLKNFSSLGG